MTTERARIEEHAEGWFYQNPAHWLLRHLRLSTPQCLTADQQAALRTETASGWVADARCASADPEAWFPGPGQSAVPQVLGICAGCPVRRACLASALLHDELGVWAGTTAAERRTAYQWLRAGRSVATVLDQALDGGLHTHGRECDRMWSDDARPRHPGRAA